MNEQDLGFLWNRHFNPLAQELNLDHFNASETILANCLPECNIRESSIGFELNGCLHHFIEVKSKQSFSKIVSTLGSCSLSISVSETGCEILIHLYAQTTTEISRQAKLIKAKLHALADTDYYEANDSQENIELFERSIPGWCFGVKKTANQEVCPA